MSAQSLFLRKNNYDNKKKILTAAAVPPTASFSVRGKLRAAKASKAKHA